MERVNILLRSDVFVGWLVGSFVRCIGWQATGRVAGEPAGDQHRSGVAGA